MLRKLRERIQSEEKGFTLIELLVVILIIGILAAIAIPAFLSQTEKAEDADAKAAARNAQTAAETYNVDNGGSYSSLSVAALVKAEPTLAEHQANMTAASNTSGDGFTLSVTSTDTSNKFSVQRFGASDATATNAAGTVARSCTTAGKGGCPTGGKW